MRENKMKKVIPLLVCATVLIMSGNTTSFAAPDTTPPNSMMVQHPSKEQMRKQFEQRLNLTDKQKAKAKAIHQKGREEMRPIMMKIEVKRQEIETVKLTKMTERAQKERIDQINSEIKELEKQAQEIRKKNSQEFESILNKKQKAELEKMKSEGRARFEQNHPPRPPFAGLGTPGFLMPKPLFPQQPPMDFFNK